MTGAYLSWLYIWHWALRVNSCGHMNFNENNLPPFILLRACRVTTNIQCHVVGQCLPYASTAIVLELYLDLFERK